MEIVLLIFVVINFFGFVAMGIDKRKAKKNHKRIREKNFFIVALLGGAVGVFVGMRHFRHKTQHRSFVYGIPVCIVINAFLVFYLLKLLN